MSDLHYRILGLLLYVPLFATAFVGMGLVLRMRRAHPRACWFAVAAGALLFLNWGVTGLMNWWGNDLAYAWARENGLSDYVPWVALNAVLAALQTAAAVLLIAAVVSGRRGGP